MLHEIKFSHPSKEIASDLLVYVKPDQIAWSYGLNTANFPTYGGEVVQILSMYVEDMTITGTVTKYEELETIYKWFVKYMQIATQGHGKKEGYDTIPVKMEYPHRGWEFEIYPKSLPGFRYGRDVVAPTWQLQAAVSEFPDNFQDSVLSSDEFNGIAEAGGFDPFGTVTAEIGFKEDNPWSAFTEKQLRAKKNEEQYKKTADYFGEMLKAWLDEDDFKNLSADYSIPKWMQQDGG